MHTTHFGELCISAKLILYRLRYFHHSAKLYRISIAYKIVIFG
jgi:hypothetical protein